MDNGESSYRRFLDGDDNGFAEIVRDYKDGLILYIDGFVKSISVAEELCEDTFVKLGIKKPHFSGKSSFKTWLYAVGRNAALDFLRKQSKNKTVPFDGLSDLADEKSLENEYFKEERRTVINKMMERLSPEYRQVLWLKYFEGFSSKETAKIMRKSTHNIETLTSRARQSLKKEFIKEGLNFEDL